MGIGVSDHPEKESRRLDRVIVWPILVPIGATLSVGVFGPMTVFLAIPVICAWLLWVAGSAIISLWCRSWRRAASLIAALALFWPAVLGGARASDYVHLALTLPYYETQINARTEFDWGAMGWHDQRALVYDSTDQLAQKVGVIQLLPEEMETVTVRHLFGHWYVQTQEW